MSADKDTGAQSRPLTFWFDFASTYSYLTAMRITDLAQEAGVTVTWRPFLLGPIFRDQGWDNSPFRIYPAKGAYMWMDVARIAADRGLPFVQPQIWPAASILAARTATAALKGTGGEALCREIFLAEFRDGHDISDPQVIAACLAAASLPASLLDQAASTDIKAELRTATEEAQGLGIFGAPSFTIGNDLYWGDDRLRHALRSAAQTL